MIIEIALGITLGCILTFVCMLAIMARTNFLVWYAKEINKTIEKVEEQLYD